MQKTLEKQLQDCMLHDRIRLQRQLRAAGRNRPSDTSRILGQIEEAKARKARRQARLPVVTFNGDLPFHACLDQIRETLQQQQVLILCGETGSGKTTQLPKLCLDVGHGIDGMIGHTQPRRIAARTVAGRIAEELGTTTGDIVGYKVRHSDHVSAETCIKVMTDGILLAELQQDRDLLHYDTIIVDEAHERSLNIDFLLGYLKILLPRRPELRVVITSATIDVERFSEHFNGAPVIEVSGRTYPVEVRYRPVQAEGARGRDIEQEQAALLGAIQEISRDGKGDILVFLEGEREIYETARYLKRQDLPDTDVLPLYSRLSQSRQSRIFMPHKRRHIVLATNVAETSITIPGIHYVIDSGFARISRYSRRNKVQQLPIEKISRASAEQRKGRCGRVANGICIRMYDESDFEQRPEFTDPEIVRTNLASVILQMKSLRLGDIKNFPFINKPDDRAINDGLRLLVELQAVSGDRARLTRTGRQIARMPLDPRYGRILLESEKLGCVQEILIILSALSSQDCRERPLDNQEKADKAHAGFTDEQSDFIFFLNVWKFFHEQSRKLSQNRLRKLCVQNFLSWIRIREWKEVHRQLQEIAIELGISIKNPEAAYSNIHTAIVAGLPGHVAVRSENREYTGARGMKVHIFPGSSLFRKPPGWIVCAELVDTSKLYARTVASINPRWLVQSVHHLIRSEVHSPWWDDKNNQVLAREKLTLFGLVLETDRIVNYGKYNRSDARRIFIQSGLVDGGYIMDAEFARHNRSVIDEIEARQEKTRRADIFDEEKLFRFYDQRIPEDIYNGPLFEKWYRSVEKENPSLLCIKENDVVSGDTGTIDQYQHPDQVFVNNAVLPVHYRFDIHADDDGASIEIPAYMLNQVREEQLDYLVPGQIEKKLEAMLKALPKKYRKKIVPIPDTVKKCLAGLVQGNTKLVEYISGFLQHNFSLQVPEDVWENMEIPGYLNVNLKVVDDTGRIISQGRNLGELQNQLSESIRKQFNSAVDTRLERDGLLKWDFPDLPEKIEHTINHTVISCYPALVDCGKSVSIHLFDTESEAKGKMRDGLIRLYMLELAKDYRYLSKHLPHIHEIRIIYSAIGHSDSLIEDLLHLITMNVFLPGDRIIRTREEFGHSLQDGQGRLVSEGNQISTLLFTILERWREIRVLISTSPLQNSEAICHVSDHLDSLVFDGFVQATPFLLLQQYPRYLDAIQKRLQKIEHDPLKDAGLRNRLTPFLEFYDHWKNKTDTGMNAAALERYRFMLEEYRVSLFAQEIRTIIPVSDKRLQQQMDTLQNHINIH